MKQITLCTGILCKTKWLPIVPRKGDLIRIYEEADGLKTYVVTDVILEANSDMIKVMIDIK